MLTRVLRIALPIALVLLPSPAAAYAGERFRIEEATIGQVQDALHQHRISCRGLVEAYLRRIDAIHALDAIRTVNPEAVEQARALDRLGPAERRKRQLFCVPVLVKDNYDVRGLSTAAGTAALLDSYPARDAFVLRRLRSAGAIVLAKTNMAELALYGSSLNSISGAVGSAYDPARDAGGSSSGSAAALAANAGLVATGTDTCSSNRTPAANNALVGFRGSLGLVSRTGIVPLSTLRDAPAPMARTVTDLARVLDVMAAVDPADPSTQATDRRQPATYTAALTVNGLRGKRIGVLRSLGPDSTVGDDPRIAATLTRTIGELRAAGATVVDGFSLPGFEGLNTTPFEAPALLDQYLKGLPDPVVADYAALAASDLTLPSTKALLTAAGQIPPGHPEYERMVAARATMRTMATALLSANHLDALVYPTTKSPSPPRGVEGQANNCELASSTGMPAVVVPAGFTADTPAVPLSVEFLGRMWDEARLLQIAYSYEQRTHHRQPPQVLEAR